MNNTLHRPLIDKIVMLIIFILMIIFFVYFNFHSFDWSEKVLLIFIAVLISINTLFMLLTPVAKIVDSKLYLYSEAIPILYDFKPKVVNLDDIVSLKISRKIIAFPRAIFELKNGRMISHAFSSMQESRILQYISFIKESSKINIIDQ